MSDDLTALHESLPVWHNGPDEYGDGEGWYLPYGDPNIRLAVALRDAFASGDLISRKDVEALVAEVEKTLRHGILTEGRTHALAAALAAMRRPESSDNRPTEAVTCPTCSGAGEYRFPDEGMVPCYNCHGEGSVTK